MNYRADDSLALRQLTPHEREAALLLELVEAIFEPSQIEIESGMIDGSCVEMRPSSFCRMTC